MSVLQRRELEDSPLADLHAIASELGIEGYRTLRRDDLIGAILAAQGGEDDAQAGVAEQGEAEPEPRGEVAEAGVQAEPLDTEPVEPEPAGAE
ncbi:MAG: Rho termination factor N-terminal domain-containing protein, partial [Actinomycetota bacterium]|nr:Rho termination factor N-terminal domain-containing protein [Actinomycetota bacterium]